MATTTKAKKVRTKQADVIGLPASLDALLSIDQVAAALDYSRRKVEMMLSAGDQFPAPDLHLGINARWRVSTVNAWIAEKVVQESKKSAAGRAG